MSRVMYSVLMKPDPSDPSKEIPSGTIFFGRQDAFDPTAESDLKHIRFPPESSSDIEVRYGNTLFHCHRSVLTKKSEFCHFLLSKPEEIKQIYFSKHSTVISEIDEEMFHHFLLSFYYPFAGEKYYLLSLPRRMEIPPNSFIDPISFIHLCRAFQIPHMDKRFIDYFYLDPRKEEIFKGIERFYWWLLAVDQYKIPQAKKILLEIITQYYPKTADGREEFMIHIEAHEPLLSASVIEELKHERLMFLTSPKK